MHRRGTFAPIPVVSSPIRHRLLTYSESVFTRPRGSTPSGRRHSSVRMIALVAVASMLSAACSGGNGDAVPAVDVSVPSVTFGPSANADGALRPVPNGFAFPNFAAASMPDQQFAAADMVRMFGDGPTVCASGSGDTCTLTAEALSWAQMVNESRQSGHCEGFIVQSLDKFAGKQTPEAAQLDSTPDVVQGIIRGFATQFIPEARGESKAWRSKKTADIVAELVTSLKAGPPKYVLGVYGDLGGHAVLPYAVEFANESEATIQVYDSNWPGRNRFVTVNVATGDWSFSFDGPDPANDANAWTGGNGDMDLSSLTSRTNGTCPFCGDGTTTADTMLTIRASSLDWSVSTSRGTVNAQTRVDGVDVIPVRAGITGIVDYMISIDPALVETKKKDAITVSLPPQSVLYTVTPSGIGRAVANKKGSVALNETSLSTKDGVEVRIAADDAAMLVRATTAVVTIRNDQISGEASIGDATTRATTSGAKNKIALIETAGKVREEKLVLSPTSDSPAELNGALTATRLPTSQSRLLANITADPSYVLPTTATTTSTAATTTTQSAGAPQQAASVTTTTRPKAATTSPTTTQTTAAPSTETTTQQTTATTQSPATTSLATTNTPPVISTFDCPSSQGVSQLKLQVIASDAESSVTIAFEETEATKYFIDAPTSSPDSVLPNNVYVFNGFMSPPKVITVKITVSDGTTSVSQTKDFLKTSTTCSIANSFVSG